MVFCNVKVVKLTHKKGDVTILILIDGFLQFYFFLGENKNEIVTILILIDGFLQLRTGNHGKECGCCHNPYFNRWFSAINK